MGIISLTQKLISYNTISRYSKSWINRFHSGINGTIGLRCRTITGTQQALTVPYGTDGVIFGKYMDLVVVGPGSISQAHTIDEWIELDQLEQSVNVFSQFVDRFCCTW